jgi:hypothetical protein
MKAKNYTLFRENIKTGDLCFTAGSSFFSRVIRFFTRSVVSHVGVFIWEDDRLMVAESVERAGVRKIHASMLFDSGKVFWGRIGGEDTIETIKWRINSPKSWYPLGTEYDLGGALSFLWSKGKNKRPYCSEYAEYVLGIFAPARKRNSTPDDLAALCGEDLAELFFEESEKKFRKDLENFILQKK